MTRNELYYLYLEELQSYNPTIEPKAGHDYVKEIMSYEVEWIDIFDDIDASKLIGFLLVGFGGNKHPDVDYYIQETFLLPGYRRKGIMSKVLSAYLAGHPGRYCLFVLNENKIARSFWFSFLNKHGCSFIDLRDVGAGDEYCTQYGFQTKSKDIGIAPMVAGVNDKR